MGDEDAAHEKLEESEPEKDPADHWAALRAATEPRWADIDSDPGTVHMQSRIGCLLKSMGPTTVINAVQQATMKRAGWRKMSIAVDSGAAESVVPEDEELRASLVKESNLV